MSKKFNLLPIIVIASLSILILVACESNKQNKNAVFERVKEGRMVSSDSILSNDEIVLKPKKVKLIKKNERPVKKIKIQDEWAQFKVEMNKKITENEIKIQRIKDTPDANSKLNRRAKRSEKSNNKLREEMTKFDEEGIENRGEFMAKMNQSVDNIENDLKDMIIKK
jgi:hypothetical protein